MTFFGEGDLDSMLSGVGGVPVVHGAESGIGTVDSFDEEILQGSDASLIGRVVAILVKTSAFPTLKRGDPITVNGVAHTLRDRMAVDDGALTQLLCLKG